MSSYVSTKELSDELTKRAGVSTITVPPCARASVKITGERFEKETVVKGPALIIINQD